METLKRRLDLLRLEGIGLDQSEIVKQLSEKYQTTVRTIQYDFAKRVVWQPKLLDLKDSDKILMKVINRYEQIYRNAAFKYLTAENENAQLGALNIMARVNEKLAESAVIPDLIARLVTIEEQANRKMKM